MCINQMVTYTDVTASNCTNRLLPRIKIQSQQHRRHHRRDQHRLHHRRYGDLCCCQNRFRCLRDHFQNRVSIDSFSSPLRPSAVYASHYVLVVALVAIMNESNALYDLHGPKANGPHLFRLAPNLILHRLRYVYVLIYCWCLAYLRMWYPPNRQQSVKEITGKIENMYVKKCHWISRHMIWYAFVFHSTILYISTKFKWHNSRH